MMGPILVVFESLDPFPSSIKTKIVRQSFLDLCMRVHMLIKGQINVSFTFICAITLFTCSG